MNCVETQKLLQERFDEGLDPAVEAQTHMAACPSCQAYRQRLHALDEALWHLPSEAPEAALAQRIRYRIEKENEPGIRFGPAGVAVAAAFAVVAVALGMVFPIPLDVRNWWGNVGLTLPHWDWPEWASLAFWQQIGWQQIGWREWASTLFSHPPDLREGLALILSQLETAWSLLASPIEAGTRFPAPVAGPVLWASLAAIIVLLAAFNGFEAFSLRSAAGGTQEPEPRGADRR